MSMLIYIGIFIENMDVPLRRPARIIAVLSMSFTWENVTKKKKRGYTCIIKTFINGWL